MLDSPEITLSRPTQHPKQVKEQIKEIKKLSNRITDKIAEPMARNNTAQILWKEHETKRADSATEKSIELQKSNIELQKQVIIDPLTGLDNRRSVFGDESKPNPSGELKRIFLEAKRERKPLSVIMMDIDHFKSVNDTFGHVSGDSVLKQLAKLFKGLIRETDIIARIGGEEFIFILQNTDLPGAKELAEKIRETVEQNNFNKENKKDMPAQITVSAGVSTFTKRSKNINSDMDLFHTADKALYLGKGGGRNQVWVTDEDILENGEVIFHFHEASIVRKEPSRSQILIAKIKKRIFH